MLHKIKENIFSFSFSPKNQKTMNAHEARLLSQTQNVLNSDNYLNAKRMIQNQAMKGLTSITASTYDIKEATIKQLALEGYKYSYGDAIVTITW